MIEAVLHKEPMAAVLNSLTNIQVLRMVMVPIKTVNANEMNENLGSIPHTWWNLSSATDAANRKMRWQPFNAVPFATLRIVLDENAKRKTRKPTKTYAKRIWNSRIVAWTLVFTTSTK